jgi:hypothetical protein
VASAQRPKRSVPVVPPRKRYGLVRILLTIAAMTALGAMLGVLAAHIGH